MMTPSNGDIFRGIHRSQKPVSQWANSEEACDLRRNRAHYDVIVMMISRFPCTKNLSMLQLVNYVTSKYHLVIRRSITHSTEI